MILLHRFFASNAEDEAEDAGQHIPQPAGRSWHEASRPPDREFFQLKRFGKNVNREGISTRCGLCSSCSGRMDHVSTFAECTPDAASAVYRRGTERPCRSHAPEAVTCDRRTVGTTDPNAWSRSSGASRPPPWARQACTIPGIFEELVTQDPDITLFELRDALAAAEGVQAHHSSIAALLSRLGFTYKKNRWWPANVAAQR